MITGLCFRTTPLLHIRLRAQVPHLRLHAHVPHFASFSWSLRGNRGNQVTIASATLCVLGSFAPLHSRGPVVQSRRRTPVAECARAFIRVFDSASGVTESSKSLHQLCCSAFLRLDRDLPAAFATIELAEIDIRCAIMDGVYVCKSTELYLPAVVAMTVPAGIVDEAEEGFVVKGALCSMSLGAVREET